LKEAGAGKYIFPLEEELSAVGFDQAGQGLHEGRLPGAVGPDEGKDGPFLHRQGGNIQDLASSPEYPQIFDR
jgi:hypothetical protein